MQNDRMPRRKVSLLLSALVGALIIADGIGRTQCAKKQTEDEVIDDMMKLLEEKSELESEVKRLELEVAKRRKQLKTGDFSGEVDLSQCPKTCPETSEKPVTSYDSKYLASLSDPKKRKASSARFLGKFPFKTTKLESIDAKDPRLVKMLQEGRPVIIKNSGLVQPAVDSWDMAYMIENIGGNEHSITLSQSRQFLYYGSPEDNSDFEFIPPFTRTPGVFAEFIDLVEQLEQAKNGSYTYFQGALSGIEQGPAMREDYDNFNWKWLDKVKPNHWGTLETNLFILGMPNVVTPAHYDGLQNLFAQIRGFKRCMLFSPAHYKNLYQFPLGHPNDRQTQINFDHPNIAMFPRFRESEGVEAIVGPGDVLYIPSYWYHHIESEMDSMTLSMNFWFNGQNGTASTKPAVPPSFKSKGKPPVTKPAEEDEEKLLFQRHRTHGLPKNTYMLNDIEEILLVADIEEAIDLSVGPENLVKFLDGGFGRRFDLVKFMDDSEHSKHWGPSKTSGKARKQPARDDDNDQRDEL